MDLFRSTIEPKRPRRGNHGNCSDDDAPPFASVHARECDSKSTTRRRRLELARSGESGPGLRDRFTMEEPLGVHQRAKRNHCFPLSQNGPGSWTTDSSRNCGRSPGTGLRYASLTSGTTTPVTGIAPMAMRTGSSMTTDLWRLGMRQSTTFPFWKLIANTTGHSGAVPMTTLD